MEIAKALILAGHGGDDRPWPTTSAGPKQLFPIATRPLLFHNLEALRAAGILEVKILASEGATEAIRHAVGDGRDWGLNVAHAHMSTSSSVGGLLAAERDFVRDEPVLVQQ